MHRKCVRPRLEVLWDEFADLDVDAAIGSRTVTLRAPGQARPCWNFRALHTRRLMTTRYENLMNDRDGNIEKSQITTPAANSDGLPPTVRESSIRALDRARGASMSTYRVC